VSAPGIQPLRCHSNFREGSLTPAAAPNQTIAGLEPLKDGGFVSTVLPETACACWRTVRFDIARAHLAADSLNVASELGVHLILMQ